MRQVMSTALVALVVGAIAGATMGAMAQSEPEAVQAAQTVEPAGLNADRVDGKHAIGFTNKRGRRAGRLVATNKGGWLPSNIVQPLWHLIKNKPAGFADGVDNVGITGLLVTSRDALFDISPGEGKSIQSPACPAGSVVVGGGAGASTTTVHMAASQPAGNHWYAAFENVGSTAERVSAWALCLSTVPASGISAR